MLQVTGSAPTHGLTIRPDEESPLETSFSNCNTQTSPNADGNMAQHITASTFTHVTWHLLSSWEGGMMMHDAFCALSALMVCGETLLITSPREMSSVHRGLDQSRIKCKEVQGVVKEKNTNPGSSR